MNNAQLELSLHRQPVTVSPRANRRRSTSSSRWWFERMRQVVDRAFDWQPTPQPPPEQTWFPGAHRQVRLGS